MPHSLAKILVHAVFSTKKWRPFLLDKRWRDEAHRYLRGVIYGDRRYGRVFIGHNGAESYYSGRGFRGSVRV